MQEFTIEKLSGAIGGLVHNMHLADLHDDDFKRLCAALWQHQVLVFKQQSLPIERHIDLGKRFGALHTHPSSAGVEGHPEVLLLRNRGKAQSITEVWHSDVSCEEKPPSISILQCIEAPPYGGDTLFANQYCPVEQMSDGLRAMIEPLRAVHSNFGLEASHPVLRTHPHTGRKALYVNRGFTKHFAGQSVEESRPLLNYLMDFGSRPDFTMRHSWDEGDIVMWDNQCVMHYAVHDYGEMPREMHRVTVAGVRPE